MEQLTPILLAQLAKLGYTIFLSGDYNVNIIGVRKTLMLTDKFDDLLYVIYKDNGTWVTKEYQITTDPGTHYLTYPMNKKGTAVLAEGQYRGAFALKEFKGYTALVQEKPVIVWRTLDENIIDDMATLDTGYFGIAIHRSKTDVVTTHIGKWSAGCQVFANPAEFAEFISILQRAAKKYGNSFTHTLVHESSLCQP